MRYVALQITIHQSGEREAKCLAWFGLLFTFTPAIIMAWGWGWKNKRDGIIYLLIFYFFSPKKTFVRKKGNVILKLNSCFLFILYCEYIFVLQAKPAEATTARDNQRTWVLRPTLTMAQHWSSRRGKFSVWLLLRWKLEETVSTVSDLFITSQQQGLHPLSPSLCHTWPVPWTLD